MQFDNVDVFIQICCVVSWNKISPFKKTIYLNNCVDMKTSDNIPHGKNKLQLLSTYSIVSGREVLTFMDCPD